MATKGFGWELLFRAVERDIVKKSDVLVAFVHWCLLKNGFKCVGVGEQQRLGKSETGSEILPARWNANETYALRYERDRSLYILRGVNTEEEIILNFLRAQDLVVSQTTLNTETLVTALSGQLEAILPTHSDILDRVQNQLVNPVLPDKAQTVPSSTTQTTSRSVLTVNEERNFRLPDEPLRIRPPRQPLIGIDHNWEPHPGDVYSVGRGDLNPGGRGGGGMIFNPFTGQGPRGVDPGLGIPGNLPRGFVPPGARFDPFGPINPDGRRPGGAPRHQFADPDADHLPPPGYDDMFM